MPSEAHGEAASEDEAVRVGPAEVLSCDAGDRIDVTA